MEPVNRGDEKEGRPEKKRLLVPWESSFKEPGKKPTKIVKSEGRGGGKILQRETDEHLVLGGVLGWVGSGRGGGGGGGQGGGGVVGQGKGVFIETDKAGQPAYEEGRRTVKKNAGV